MAGSAAAGAAPAPPAALAARARGAGRRQRRSSCRAIASSRGNAAGTGPAAARAAGDPANPFQGMTVAGLAHFRALQLEAPQAPSAATVVADQIASEALAAVKSAADASVAANAKAPVASEAAEAIKNAAEAAEAAKAKAAEVGSRSSSRSRLGRGMPWRMSSTSKSVRLGRGFEPKEQAPQQGADSGSDTDSSDERAFAEVVAKAAPPRWAAVPQRKAQVQQPKAPPPASPPPPPPAPAAARPPPPAPAPRANSTAPRRLHSPPPASAANGAVGATGTTGANGSARSLSAGDRQANDPANPFVGFTMAMLHGFRAAQRRAVEDAERHRRAQEEKRLAAAREQQNRQLHGSATSPHEATTGTGVAWVGREVAFRTSKHEKGDRGGRWDAGAAGALAPIVEADQHAPSWRQKLQAVQRLLCEGEPSSELVAGIAVYLYWIASGAIGCAEDGTHYRPNHHAKAARASYEALENLHAGSTAWAAARRVHTRLPSFSDEYTKAEPLTRIRDIAHGKGDKHGKCREVRQEIKHTIQNKLHRCAGPEDLIATEKMLAKLTAPGTDYPEEFVNEFRIFYRELQEFFNASGLEDRLGGLQGKLGGDAPAAIDAFLSAKRAADAAGTGEPGLALSALEALERARESIVRELPSASDVSVRQSARLADIGLEEHAFVLLSQVIGAAEAGLANAPALCQALERAAKVLSGSSTRSGEAVRVAELAATGDAALAGAAARELAGALADDAEGLFGPAARALGSALGIEQRVVDVYVESDVRGSVVYQLGRLADLLLKEDRAASGAAAVDCLVAGEAVGLLRCVPRLEPGCVSADEGPHVCLVAAADGDEEVGAAGGSVVGVVLCHDMPHLSHLALRARQEGVVTATCEDGGRLNTIRAMEGTPVRIVASAEGVTVVQASPAELEQARAAWLEKTRANAPGAGATAQVMQPPPPADETFAGQMLFGPSIRAQTCGAKSAACARLSDLALASGGAFAAPQAVALPFGSMRAALSERELDSLDDALARAETAEGPELDDACERLQAIARTARPAEAALRVAVSVLGSNSLAVRSSANVEDLAGMSAAGLYDSFLNVPARDAHDVAAVGEAAAAVWASLYTRRAVLARRAAGVPQRSANMAVLMQPLVDARASFIMMTSNPITGDSGQCYLEMAEGLGETLASGNTRGKPWRVTVGEDSSVATLAEGSMAAALVAADGGGLVEAAADGSISGQILSDEGSRVALCRRVAAAGRAIREAEGGEQQDVEGAIDSDGRVWVVQARPQP